MRYIADELEWMQTERKRVATVLEYIGEDHKDYPICRAYANCLDRDIKEKLKRQK